MPVMLGCELIPVNVEGWIDWHGGEEGMKTSLYS
jgi:hypothetical protein